MRIDSTDYGDKVVKGMKQGFQLELSNLQKGNGVVESILDRIGKKQGEFDKIVRTQKIDPILRGSVTTWLYDEFYPIVNKFRKTGAREEDWREVNYPAL